MSYGSTLGMGYTQMIFWLYFFIVLLVLLGYWHFCCIKMVKRKNKKNLDYHCVWFKFCQRDCSYFVVGCVVVLHHSVNHQLFADDTQLQKSAPLNEVTNFTKELNACTDNIKTWMTENQLKLNDDKTEALLFPFSSFLKPSTVPLPDSITLGSHNTPFSDSARNLGFILDSKLSVMKHIIKICQTAYFELKRNSSIRRRNQDSCYFLYPFMAWLLQLSPYGYT